MNKNGNDRQDLAKDKFKRGFSAMSSEKQKEIASKGGKAAHKLGTAHKWSSNEAREAGKKGGQKKGKHFPD